MNIVFKLKFQLITLSISTMNKKCANKNGHNYKDTLIFNVFDKNFSLRCIIISILFVISFNLIINKNMPLGSVLCLLKAKKKSYSNSTRRSKNEVANFLADLSKCGI